MSWTRDLVRNVGTLLTELQGMRKRPGEVHRVSTKGGVSYSGTWEEIVLQMKMDDLGSPDIHIESIVINSPEIAYELELTLLEEPPCRRWSGWQKRPYTA